MKQALIVVVSAIALVAWFFLWFRNEDAVSTSAGRPWPGGMGSLETVDDRWPSLKGNEIATGAPDTPMPLVLDLKGNPN